MRHEILAFPRPLSIDRELDKVYSAKRGKNLRDYFATKIIAGLTHPEIIKNIRLSNYPVIFETGMENFKGTFGHSQNRRRHEHSGDKNQLPQRTDCAGENCRQLPFKIMKFAGEIITDSHFNRYQYVLGQHIDQIGGDLFPGIDVGPKCVEGGYG